MNKEIVGTQTIYRKKYPVRKKKMPFREEQKKYYEPLYGTPDCPYEGKKRGRKSMKELQSVKPILKVESKSIIMYFD
tara:strand:- start:1230 stop:1460 length:231 start_codon:yes stop_codon:yes gene_type:complete